MRWQVSGTQQAGSKAEEAAKLVDWWDSLGARPQLPDGMGQRLSLGFPGVDKPVRCEGVRGLAGLPGKGLYCLVC